MTTDAQQLDSALERLPGRDGQVRDEQGLCHSLSDAAADRYKQFLRVAYDRAALSPDRSNQNGAVLLSNNNGLCAGWGYNNFTPGIEYTTEHLANRDWKLAHIEHAERTAIFDAARQGNQIEGGILVCPWAACSDCARAIVLSGIALVVVHKQRMNMTPDRWKQSVEVGMNIIRSGGVRIESIDSTIGGNTIIVNGEAWQP